MPCIRYTANELKSIWKEMGSLQRKVSCSIYGKIKNLEIHRCRHGHRGCRGGKKIALAEPSVKNCTLTCNSDSEHAMFKLGLINCQSACNKSDLIKDHIKDHDIDVLALTETWFKHDEPASASRITPSGYRLLHVPRKHCRGGGVGILYKSCLCLKICKTTLQPNSFEFLETELTHGAVKIKVVTVYRPPLSKKNIATWTDFFQEFSALLDRYSLFTGKLFILGDFNIHWDNQQGIYTRDFQRLLQDHYLQQIVVEPTHESGHILDLVITRDNDGSVHSVSIQDSLSDHCSVHCLLQLEKPKPVKKKITYRKVKSIGSTQLRLDIEESSLLADVSSSAEELVHQYNEVMRELLDKHAPQRSCFIVEQPAVPWYNECIANAKRKRRQLERRWRRTKLTVDKQLFKDQRNVVKSLFEDAKAKYYNEHIVECGNDQKALYGIVNKLMHRKTDSAAALPHHSSDGELAGDFSRYFIGKIESIRCNLESNTSTSDRAESESEREFDRNVPSSCDDHLTAFMPSSPLEIQRIIRKTPSKSCSLDPIPTTVVKENDDLMAMLISRIVNASLQEGKFPEELKLAHVIPVLKKPSLDREEMSSYRPISNLPFLAKVVEKVAAKRLMTHLQDNDLHEAMQSAYKQLHSVETALLRISDDILRAVDNKKAVIIILLDLSAAFDTIDHEVLLQRLHVDFKVDATALAWFRSYLHCRRQMVNINGTLSEEALLKYGVPQGSVLGPLLFTLYIAPLGEIARHHGLQVHFYADDTQLYVTFDPGVRDEDADAISRLTTCLAEIRQWMVLNFVKLNDDKTEYLVITSPHMQNKIVPQNLQVGCVSVPPSENARNLGVFFDQCMKMDKHISKVCQATYYQLRNISAIRSLLTRSAAESLIHSLVTSRIDFCNSLLVGLPSAMLNRLQGVQNAAARLLTGTKKYDHITPILTELHWLPIKYRIEFKILLLTFKAVHGLAPGYVTSLIEQRRLRPGLRSSGTGITLHVPITHLRGYGDRAFSSIAPRLWNSLPSSLREIDSIDLFKSSLKTHLFQQMCNN